MVHQGASTRTYKQGSPLYLLFLDWEKAFDRVTHAALFSALERMQLPDKIVNVVKALYRNPTFQVGMDNYESKWHRQDAGIRQGCPLSPYLFLIVMHVLFQDIYSKHGTSLSEGRPPGVTFDVVLFADDTMCVSSNKAQITRMLHAIEKESARFGLNLNKTKCELMVIGQPSRIKYRDGTHVPCAETVKYLGCSLDSKNDVGKEISARIRNCYQTMQRLDAFWLHSDCSVSQKIQVFSAVCRSKLLYGLETTQLTPGQTQRLDGFQLKGLRKILGIPTTFGQMAQGQDRTNTN
eukprot:6985006-Pyramimonas_sp.AAC.1